MAIDFAQPLAQACGVPLLGIGVRGDVLGHQVVDHLVAHVVDGLGNLFALHDSDALFEDHLALVVHHVVELEQVLADVEVARLDLLLRLLQRLVDPGVDDGFAVLQSQFLQHAVHALRAEDAHQVVFQRKIE